LNCPVIVSTDSHRDLIVDQFTRQAAVFSTAKPIADEAALRLLLEFSGAQPHDTVLDVGCGGGLVVCAFARVVAQATGIDLTPTMLTRARMLAQQQGLSNVKLDQGEVTRLPYAQGAFTIVLSRFTFHHFLDPLAVLKEMVRVCAPGGTVMVIDVQASADPIQADEFNRMEKLRDPSHVAAMPLSQLQQLFAAAGLPAPRVTEYELRDELENLLARSFPNPGDADRIRAIFAASVEDNRLGIPIRREDDHLYYAYPVSVLAARRPPI
jgi:ubiquinone/menaquinone biosynthesis C-methylase UbiE